MDGTGPSDDMLRGLLAAAPDALLAVNQHDEIVFANDQAVRLFGWSRLELLGVPVNRVIPAGFGGEHPTDRSGYESRPTTRSVGAALKLWARRKDGSEFPAEINLSAFSAEGATLLAAAIRDVTISRRTEQRFRAVLAAGPDAIVGVDASGRIEFVNEQAERLFGWTSQDLIGQQVEVLVPADFRKRHIADRARYLADSNLRPVGTGLQLQACRKDGSSFPAEISLGSVSDEYGAVMVLAAVRDVSDQIELAAGRQRRALDAQREQSQRLESLGQLAGGVAHDFNNLLGVILNYQTLVVRRVTDPIAIVDLGEIKAAAERGAALTRQLLMFARQDIVHSEPVDVVGIIRGAASMLERTLGEQIEMRLDLPHERLVATADRYQLEQIVFNLAINARDAMPRGGVLTIACEPATTAGAQSTSDVIIRISDTGDGMTAEVAARAFEPFFTTKPRGKGTGLGLSTVYGIVRQSGGTVTIDSNVGVGTVVTVRLRGAELGDDVARTSATVSRRGHERILFVEDEIALRVGTTRLLVDNGYEVVGAGDGVEALELVEGGDEPFDLVVTDVAMPRMGGRELARRLADREPQLPVIFMSGYDSGAPLSGQVLAKPVGVDVLLRSIREVIDG